MFGSAVRRCVVGVILDAAFAGMVVLSSRSIAGRFVEFDVYWVCLLSGFVSASCPAL